MNRIDTRRHKEIIKDNSHSDLSIHCRAEEEFSLWFKMHLLCVSRWRLVQCWCILVDDDRQILVHVHHQEEISSGDWFCSTKSGSTFHVPPQYAAAVIGQIYQTNIWIAEPKVGKTPFVSEQHFIVNLEISLLYVLFWMYQSLILCVWGRV